MLEIRDLNIEFHDHSVPETVVYDFDLSMEEGDIVGIVGESGSGKTMSALALCGLLSRHDMTCAVCLPGMIWKRRERSFLKERSF